MFSLASIPFFVFLSWSSHQEQGHLHHQYKMSVHQFSWWAFPSELGSLAPVPPIINLCWYACQLCQRPLSQHDMWTRRPEGILLLLGWECISSLVHAQGRGVYLQLLHGVCTCLSNHYSVCQVLKWHELLRVWFAQGLFMEAAGIVCCHQVQRKRHP